MHADRHQHLDSKSGHLVGCPHAMLAPGLVAAGGMQRGQRRGEIGTINLTARASNSFYTIAGLTHVRMQTSSVCQQTHIYLTVSS